MIKKDFKYFIGYKVSEKIRPLCIFCPQMITYKRNFDENRHIYFLIKEEKLVIKYMESKPVSTLKGLQLQMIKPEGVRMKGSNFLMAMGTI